MMSKNRNCNRPEVDINQMNRPALPSIKLDNLTGLDIKRFRYSVDGND